MEDRPIEMKHRDFMRFELPKRWPAIHRVRLGNPKLPHREISEWCSVHFLRWYRSDGYEVYFFPDKDEAFHFKTRWAGASHDSSESLSNR